MEQSYSAWQRQYLLWPDPPGPARFRVIAKMESSFWDALYDAMYNTPGHAQLPKLFDLERVLIELTKEVQREITGRV